MGLMLLKIYLKNNLEKFVHQNGLKHKNEKTITKIQTCTTELSSPKRRIQNKTMINPSEQQFGSRGVNPKKLTEGSPLPPNRKALPTLSNSK